MAANTTSSRSSSKRKPLTYAQAGVDIEAGDKAVDLIETMMKRTHGGLGGVALRGNTIAFGEFAIRTLEPAWITARQIEAARRTITHHLKRGGKVWIRIFPDKVVTSKPAETRMGSGKGAPDHYVAVVKPGHVLFEIGGVRQDLAHEALRLASHKLPVATKFMIKEGLEIGGEETAAAS